MTNREKRILVAMPVAQHTSRLHLQGIVDYLRGNATLDWRLQLNLNDEAEQDLDTERLDVFDGVIAKVTNAEDRNRFAKASVPCVLFDSTSTSGAKSPRRDGLVTFVNDHATEGRAAAEYFLDRRYRSFAYVGSSRPTPWSDERRRGFTERLAESGFECRVFRPSPVTDQRGRGRLLRWLAELPRPTALFAVHDRRAQELSNLAQAVDRKIPQDIAILGVDNDDLICNATTPTLSSIAVDARHAGWLCAEMLDRLLRRKPVDPCYRTRHTVVVTRASTDSTAVSDPIVARALAAICRDPGADLSGEALANLAGCSKRTLQLHLRKELGTTVAEEVARMRLAEARRRLETTDESVGEIAEACGFCSTSHLGMSLRAAYGMGPKELRAAALGR